MKEELKPEWWPVNPYPKSIFTMERDKYQEIVPDEKTRTALSGMLGREFWDIASRSIWKIVDEQLTAKTAECEGLHKIIDELEAESVDESNLTLRVTECRMAEAKDFKSTLADNQDKYFAKLKAKDKVTLHFKSKLKKYEGALEKIKVKHNLLKFLSEGKCQCDPDVGAVPCIRCGAEEVLALATSALTDSGDKCKTCGGTEKILEKLCSTCDYYSLDNGCKRSECENGNWHLLRQNQPKTYIPCPDCIAKNGGGEDE